MTSHCPAQQNEPVEAVHGSSPSVSGISEPVTPVRERTVRPVLSGDPKASHGDSEATDVLKCSEALVPGPRYDTLTGIVEHLEHAVNVPMPELKALVKMAAPIVPASQVRITGATADSLHLQLEHEVRLRQSLQEAHSRHVQGAINY
eukprot:SAG31_NODE_20285_length_578_cov_1.390397_1_plen_147_part_00